jgi:hypothetical protein
MGGCEDPTAGLHKAVCPPLPTQPSSRQPGRVPTETCTTHWEQSTLRWNLLNALGAVHTSVEFTQRTGSSPHFGGTYRPSSVKGTHKQLMESTRLCVKITQERRLTGMTNASDRLYDQVPVASTWQFTDVERGHTTCLYSRSVHTSGSLSLAEAAYTLPASSGSVARNVRRNTASCMYRQKEKSNGVRSEERSGQVILLLLPVYFRWNFRSKNCRTAVWKCAGAELPPSCWNSVIWPTSSKISTIFNPVLTLHEQYYVKIFCISCVTACITLQLST